MDFRILGPLEAHDGDKRLALGGAKQRALLGLLLLHANETVSSDRLVDELWAGEGLSERLEGAAGGGLAPAQGDRAGSGDGQGEPGSWSLARRGTSCVSSPASSTSTASRTWSPSGRTAGDAAAASDAFREALALWRGPPLSDLAYESFAQSEIARLDELHTATVEDRIAADLELGRHAELIGELQALVGRQPLRERLRGPADARALSLGTTGRGARGLSERSARPGRRAGHRACARAAGARSGDPGPGSGSRPARARPRARARAAADLLGGVRRP